MSKLETDKTQVKINQLDMSKYVKLEKDIEYQNYAIPLVTLFQEKYPADANQQTLQLFKKVLHEGFYKCDNYRYQGVEDVLQQMES